MRKTILALTVLTFACTITPSAPGLKLHSELVKNRYILGEPIYLTVVLENTGESAVTVPGGVASRFLMIRIANGRGSASYHGPTMSIKHVASTKKEFAGGAKDTYTYELTSMYPLWTAGRYEIEAAFAGNRDEYLDGYGNIVEDADTIWAGEIRSPKLVIELQEPRGVDKEALEFLKQSFATSRDPLAYKRGIPVRFFGTLRYAPEFIEKFPSSLYTAYALCTKHHIDLRDPMPENPRPQEIVESLLRNARNPVNEYRRSVRPGERKEEIEDLWLILKHQPEFVFLDGVHEALGLLYVEEQDLQQAQGMFEKVAEVTKDAKRKERMGAFVEALKGRADKPERGAEQPKALEE